MAGPLNFMITGAGRGIGRGLSRLLFEKGHHILLLDNNKVELDHTLSILHRLGPNSISGMLCDLKSRHDIDAAAEMARKTFDGHLDVLINNAAYTGGVLGPPMESEAFIDSWDASVKTNLTGPVLLSRACLPLLARSEKRAKAGCIIHISSTRAHQSEPNSEAYAASKAGLIGLTHSMAVSLREKGIAVNVILPGWINAAYECKEADERGQRWEDDLTDEDHEWHLSGRVGKVEDILMAVEYLNGASFVSGAEIVVDGGVSRKMIYPE